MYSKLDKLFRLNYIQLLIVRNTNTARLHSTCRLSNTRSCRNNRRRRYWINSCSRSRHGHTTCAFLHKYNSLSQACKWIRGLICQTIHLYSTWLSWYCDYSWWCSTSRLNCSWCRWNRRRKWHSIVVVEDDMVIAVASAKFLTYNV
jgi:hypothetical protein